MAAVTIRVATAVEIGAIAHLIERAVRISNAPDYEPAAIERIVANFTPERIGQKMTQRDVFVGLKVGVLVGTVSLGGDKLHSLFVDPSWQGKGIGRRLVDHLEAHAAALGVAVLRVSSSLTARPFYEKLGYRLLAFEPRQDGSTFAMSKLLTP
jgi:GNAT superfamily N-acetyltransferase